jgi:hypothetical protein
MESNIIDLISNAVDEGNKKGVDIKSMLSAMMTIDLKDEKAVGNIIANKFPDKAKEVKALIKDSDLKDKLAKLDGLKSQFGDILNFMK